MYYISGKNIMDKTLYDKVGKRKKDVNKPPKKGLNASDNDFCTCDGIQDLIAMTGICRKCNKQVTY